MRPRRVFAALAAAGCFVLFPGSPAGAVVNPPNTVGCSGKALINTRDRRFAEKHARAERERIRKDRTLNAGKRTEALRSLDVRSRQPVYSFTITSAMEEVRLPTTGFAIWEGGVTTTTHNHSGKIWLEVGPINVPLGEWGVSKNEKDDNQQDGTKQFPDWVDKISGKFVLLGYHNGDEGGCSGYVKLILDNGKAMTPLEAAAAVLTALAAAGTAGAGMTKKK